MKSAKILAVIVAGVIAICSTAFAEDTQTEAQVAGDIRVARWDVILNDNGLESIDSTANRVVHTASVVYSAALFNADALRAAVNAAAAVNGFEGGSQTMGYTSIEGVDMNHMPPLFFNYSRGRIKQVGVQGVAAGTEAYKKNDDGHIYINLDHANFNISINTFDPSRGVNDRMPQDKPATISYDGQLSLGDALAFSAVVKDKAGMSYRHIIVWEPFKAETRYERDFRAIKGSERWCQLGPKGIRHSADIATVWASHAKHDPSTVSAKWEQALEDGKVIRLTGITRFDKWMYCWWDADGQPVLGSDDSISYLSNDIDHSVRFSTEITGPSDEWKKQTPVSLPGQYLAQHTGPFSFHFANNLDVSGEAVIGVPVGEWEQVGEINKGGTIRVGDVTYMLRDIRPAGDNQLYVLLYPASGVTRKDDFVTISAVSQDGREIDTYSVQPITSYSQSRSYSGFQGISLNNLKTFHVWRRKRQWVTFSGFATEPVTPPNDQITATELAAAVVAGEKSQQPVQTQILPGH
jgi:hypothetical protein